MTMNDKILKLIGDPSANKNLVGAPSVKAEPLFYQTSKSFHGQDRSMYSHY